VRREFVATAGAKDEELLFERTVTDRDSAVRGFATQS
jgi:hypothetical protein